LICGRFLHVQNRCDTKAECRSWHQVRDDTLVSLSFVDLTELLLVIDFDANAILENVLNMLLALNQLAILIFTGYHFLEVRRMAPSDLNRSRCLSHMREDSGCQAVLLDDGHILFDDQLFWVVDRTVFVVCQVVHRHTVS